MFHLNEEDDFWKSQEKWNIVSWKLHKSTSVHTLETDTEMFIHMLVEKKYPLMKKVLLQMLELKLESEDDKIGESSLTGPELVLDMTDKVVLVKEKLKAARDRQKSYVDNRRKPLEFEVGDRVMLKVSPWKGVIRFGKKSKLAPSLHVPLDEIKVDKTLRFVEEPVENSDREVKRFLTSLLDDGRGSGSWMFLFVWSGYAAMRTLLWAGKVSAVARRGEARKVKEEREIEKKGSGTGGKVVGREPACLFFVLSNSLSHLNSLRLSPFSAPALISLPTSSSRYVVEVGVGKEHGEQLLDSVKNGPFKFGTIDVPGTTTSHATTKEKTLADLTPEEKILVQDIWDRFKLLMEGSELSLQKRESKLYNEFTSEKGETIHLYYLRFVKLINDMNTVGMTIKGYALKYEAPAVHQQSTTVSPQLDSGLVVPSFLSTDFPIESLNKAMTFISSALTSRYPHTNNQLRTSSNQGTKPLFKMGKVIGTRVIKNTRNATQNQSKDIRCYNCKDDIDAFDSDCDEAPTTSAVFMENLTSYDSNVLSENRNKIVQGTTFAEQQDAMIMSVIDEMSNQVAKCNAVNQENKIMNESLTIELERYKEMFDAFQKVIQTLKFQLSANIKSNKSLKTPVDVLKKETNGKQDKHIEEILVLEKEKEALENIIYKMAQRKQHVVYIGSALGEKHDAIYVIDTEETLMLAEEKQAFWLPISKIASEKPTVQPEPVQNDLPRKLPTTSMVKQNLLKLKSHLDNFDKVIKVRTKVTGQNEAVHSYDDIVEYADMEKSFVDAYN
ncbi:hypothetical protein Tco_1227210 [Tanacetum coccineum]